jgi:hypothetical protein
MNFFEHYEKIKEAKKNLPPETTWTVVESSEYYTGINSVGAIVYLRKVDSVHVSYSYFHSSLLSPREYKRPIEVFIKTFRPILQ